MENEKEKALQIIEGLNFNKACKIICEGIAEGMPRFIERIKKTTNINLKDLEEALVFEGKPKSEIFDSVLKEAASKRDEVVNAYLEVFKTIDQNSPNPEFTKNENKQSVYRSIVNEKEHFRNLSQLPSDWKNIDLFGRLWGKSILANTFSLQEKGYKKHLVENGFDFLQIPSPILKKYDSYQYQYIDLNGFEVPVPKFSILSLETHRVSLSEVPMLEYAKGFIDGYHSSLIPFIDTEENRREVLFIEVLGKGAKSFPAFHNGKNIEFRNKDIYESGLFEGKRYKA